FSLALHHQPAYRQIPGGYDGGPHFTDTSALDWSAAPLISIVGSLRLAASAAATYGLLAWTTVATGERAKLCDVTEPDSLGISWTAPCEEGRWLLDPQSGCRMWDWHPEPEDSSTWTGSCPAGRKEGRGVAHWFEHGHPIDRFEGLYRRGKREGFGRYDWPTEDHFEGTYADDLPDGRGTVTIDGVSFSGIWRRGCLVLKDKSIAIGVPLGTCGGGKARGAARE